jgi:ElaA protein
LNLSKKKIAHSFDCYRFEELSNLLLYKALKLRSDIFVVEQNCVYPDLDDKDIHPNTLHLLLEVEQAAQTKNSPHLVNNVTAYARCIAPGVSFPGSSIGRVAVAAAARGNGVARLLMLEAMSFCKQNWPEHNIQIGAQVYLQNFYTQLGFIPFSEPYDEDGIMHIDMEFKTRT